MNSFIELNLPTTIDTSSADLIEDFFMPVLRQAVSIDHNIHCNPLFTGFHHYFGLWI